MRVVASPHHQRRDANGNRDAILDAARELFADSTDVAMYQIARRAGVGQATLYRNFPNRAALAAEIIGERVERLAADSADAADDGDAFFILLERLIDSIVDLYALSELARDDVETDSRLARTRLRVEDLLDEPLRNAKASRALREDISINDVFLVLKMVRGAMETASDRPSRHAIADRLTVLIRSGLATPEATSGL
jgi:AcrR family transcriptional regulator